MESCFLIPLSSENLFVVLSGPVTEDAVSVPLRASLSHVSKIFLNPSWELTLGFTGAGGLESRRTAGAETLYPSIGFELRVEAALHL